MPAARHLSLLFLTVLTAVFVAGCPTLPDVVSCGVIPPGGCPVGRGGTCGDVSCEILYACVDGRWVSTQVCAQADGGSTDDGGDGGLGGDASACTPVMVIAKTQGAGCMPDLQQPDCPIEAAGACEETACLSGCIDFYVCAGNLSWSVVAYCDDNGTFVSM